MSLWIWFCSSGPKCSLFSLSPPPPLSCVLSRCQLLDWFPPVQSGRATDWFLRCWAGQSTSRASNKTQLGRFVWAKCVENKRKADKVFVRSFKQNCEEPLDYWWYHFGVGFFVVLARFVRYISVNLAGPPRSFFLHYMSLFQTSAKNPK